MSKDEIIMELVELVLMQEKELDKLRSKIERIKQYLEVYEEYIEDRKEIFQNGNGNTSRDF